MSPSSKGQAHRLEIQKSLAGGPVGIFGHEAKKHDLSLRRVSQLVSTALAERFSHLTFRHRAEISKKEINGVLSSIDQRLGNVLFVQNSGIRPDGGIIEVQDRKEHYRVVLVGESKHQGNDVEKIKAGIKQGKNKDQDLMMAGNAIERVHKNITEVKNFMLNELHFPYVVFLQGSNFATHSFNVKDPTGRPVPIRHDLGSLNRIDRVTASSFGLEINHNYCCNQFVEIEGRSQMLQAASLYFQANPWDTTAMLQITWEIAITSLEILWDDLPQAPST